MMYDKDSLRFDESEKFKFASHLLEQGLITVQILADSDGVVLPAHLYEDEIVVLNFSHRFGIKDFVCDHEGLRASLSFSGSAFFCEIPWHSVISIASKAVECFYIWPLSLPKEILDEYLPSHLNEKLNMLREEASLDDETEDEPPIIYKPLREV